MNEIYSAIFTRLDTSLTYNVLGHVPENYSTFPYIKVNPLELSDNDTDTETGFSAVIQIESYSRYPGVKEVGEVQQAVYDLLHRATIADTASYGISTIHQEFSNILTESDGLTRVSVQRFIVIFEPLPQV